MPSTVLDHELQLLRYQFGQLLRFLPLLLSMIPSCLSSLTDLSNLPTPLRSLSPCVRSQQQTNATHPIRSWRPNAKGHLGCEISRMLCADAEGVEECFR